MNASSPAGEHGVLNTLGPLTGTLLRNLGITVVCDAALAADDEGDLLASTRFRTSRVSPDGLSLAFQSTRSLTGYNNRAAVPGQCATYEKEGVFVKGGARYDYEAGHCIEVYEYEPDGTGSCQTPSGCLSLISTGSSSTNSYFLDASTTGDDAFIEDTDQLVPQDGDEARDVYDARVDGGFPSPAPSSCAGEACKPPVTSAPSIYGAPPSATFLGAGNPLAPVAPVVVKKAKVKPLTRAQKLTKALVACHRDKKKAKRVACRKQARKRFAPAKKSAR